MKLEAIQHSKCPALSEIIDSDAEGCTVAENVTSDYAELFLNAPKYRDLISKLATMIDDTVGESFGYDDEKGCDDATQEFVN